MRLTFAGTVYRINRPAGLMEAIRDVHRREPELAALLEVNFIGRVVDSERAALEAMEPYGVHLVPYMGHREVLVEQSASHFTMCILDDVPGADKIYPGKIFELIHLGRPCLVLCPDGALARLVEETGLGPRLRPGDVDAIADLLIDLLRQFRAGNLSGDVRRAPLVGVERFDRRVTAGQFAEVLRTAIARASTRR